MQIPVFVIIEMTPADVKRYLANELPDALTDGSPKWAKDAVVKKDLTEKIIKAITRVPEVGTYGKSLTVQITEL